MYDFIATPADAPADSDVAAQGTTQTAEQIDMGRQLGAQIARELVADIEGMGLPAQKAVADTSHRSATLRSRGYLLSIVQRSEAKRLAIGFGSGASELTTAVEGFPQMTAQGLRKLGCGTVASGGSKAPGAALPAAVALVSGNPIGQIVGSGMKIYGEASGRSKVKVKPSRTADEIADNRWTAPDNPSTIHVAHTRTVVAFMHIWESAGSADGGPIRSAPRVTIRAS